MIGEALGALSKLPTPVGEALLGLGLDAIRELAAWFSGDDDHPEPTELLDRLPDVLKSEIALARAEARVKAATDAAKGAP